MAIVFDAAAGGNNGGVGGSYDFTGLTVGSGSNRALVVGVTADSTANQVSGVVWDPSGANQSFTRIGSEELGVSRFVSLWYLSAPASGNKTQNTMQHGVIGSAGGC